jgi:hypothetical protein
MAKNRSSGLARTPAADLLHRTLVDSAGSYRKCRIILDAELKRISAELNRSDLLPARRAELLMQLLEVQRVLGQDLKSIGQLVTAKPAPGTGEIPSGVPSAADVMAELTEGRKTGRSGHGQR